MAFQKIKESTRSFDWSSLAPYCLGVGLVSLVVTVVAWIIRSQFDQYAYIPLAVGIIGILTFILLDPQKVLAAIGSRQARFGLNAVVMTVALLGILVTVNTIVYQQSGQRKLWVDLTEDKSNSLTPETVRTLQTLAEPVVARAYYSTNNTTWTTALDLLEKYKSESSGKFTYQRINPETSPVLAKQDGITRDATIVLAAGTRTVIVNNASEQELTSAMLKLENPGEHVVYFLTGHGESKIDNTDVDGMSQITDTLQHKSYAVKTLDFSTTPAVPDDASSIVIAGPKQPLLPFELNAIKEFLNKGGGLVLLENPYPVSGMDPTKDILAQYLASDFGVSFQNDVIVDMLSNSPLVAIALAVGNSPITQIIGQYMIFPTAQSLATAPVTGLSLAQTNLVYIGTSGYQAWGETDFSQLGSLDVTNPGAIPPYDEKTDIPAPLVVAVSSENQAAGPNKNLDTRVVVIGDEDFAENRFVVDYANSDLLLNSVDWVSKQDQLISLTPKTQTSRIMIAPQGWVLNAIELAAVCLLPGLFLVWGGTVWYMRRRHK